MNKYLGGIYSSQEFRLLDRPSIVFFGRSNVGKSSLINYLLGDKVAKTSQRPGKTIAIHLFDYHQFYVIDLPGYGYSRAGINTTDTFSMLINNYLNFLITNQQLFLVCLLIDLKVGFQKKDLEAVNYLKNNNIPFFVCFTKKDKACQKEQSHSLKQIKEMGITNYVISSASNKIGKELIDNQITTLVNSLVGESNE